MTQRLIEKWLPIAALGEESVRERRSMTALPPTYYLHVWWARRPLVASRAAILASLLPGDADRDKFVHAVGIHGDPAEVRRRIDAAKRTGEDLGPDVYGYQRAFTYQPTPEELSWFRGEAGRSGVTGPIVCLDPTAGGGSIPFESERLGLRTFANDLNPVAALILRATAEWPIRFGRDLVGAFDAIAKEFVSRAHEKFAGVFPAESDDTKIEGYVWARTIICPHCDGLVPLSPNWRLSKPGNGVKLHPDVVQRRCRFEIVEKLSLQSPGTVTGGDAKCPYADCLRIVDGEEIHRQAQTGTMGDQLYAIVYKKRIKTKTKAGKNRFKWVRGYRAPVEGDDNAASIQRRVEESAAEWGALDLLPSEMIPTGQKTAEPLRFGYRRWRDLFSPRQLLGHVIGVEIFTELVARLNPNDQLGRVALAYLSLSLDKLRDYNSRMTRWHSGRQVIVNTFDRHDFAFKWSYAEMAPLIVGGGYEWVIKQTSKCIRELVELVRSDSPEDDRQGTLLTEQATSAVLPEITITCRSATNLNHIDDSSVDAVVMDPPYYDNVMYAELSDFFYVWLKRTSGQLYPELFTQNLTDKENEAVANPARFQGQKGAKALAGRDYQERMAEIFSECHRVMKPDGILTVMFTHKATGAWDALTTGLMNAGFTITASWPVNTEAEGSLHIKDKSAAKSTIFLVCRPRKPRQDGEIAYWEDVEPLVAAAVRTRIAEYQSAGISGVDLYLSCFGPALEEFARHWPLRRGQPRRVEEPKRRTQAALFAEPIDPYAVTPEDALNSARREVKNWRMERLLRANRLGDVDSLTEWFVLAWDAFKTPEFPYDEALRLARVVGIDLDRDIVGHLAEKKASSIVLWDSEKRANKAVLGALDGSRGMINALHSIAHRVRSLGLQAGKDLVERAGLDKDVAFLTALAAVLEVLPVSSAFTKVKAEKGGLADAASDFEALENLRRLMFTDRIPEPEQLKIWS